MSGEVSPNLAKLSEPSKEMFAGEDEQLSEADSAFIIRVARRQETAREYYTFRDEVVDFVCLSQNLVIQYHLKNFERYNKVTNSDRLTEETVVGTPLKVLKGEVESSLSGVSIIEFDKGATNKLAFVDWLRDYVSTTRKDADDAHGLSTGLMLDKNGVEINSFGVSSPMFAHKPEKPISEVVILLGGPRGIEDDVLPTILNAFDDTAGSGLHLKTARVKLPGGLQHSYVALGDLLNYHDRGHLLPILEDYQFFHRDDRAHVYSTWFNRMVKIIGTIANIKRTVQEKKELLDGFGQGLQKFLPKHLTEGISYAPDGTIQWPADENKDGEGVRPADVEKLLTQLEVQSLLPRRRGWRVCQCLQMVEPGRALVVVRHFERILSHRLLQGRPVEDPWTVLAERFDKVIAASAQGYTEKDVIEACKAARIAWGEETKDAHATKGLAQEVRSLRRFSCSEAVDLVKQVAKKHKQRPSHGLIAEVLLSKSVAEEGTDFAEALRDFQKGVKWCERPAVQGAQSPRRQPQQPSHPPPNVPRPPPSAPPPNLMALGAASGRTAAKPAAPALPKQRQVPSAGHPSSASDRPAEMEEQAETQRSTKQTSRVSHGLSSASPVPPRPPAPPLPRRERERELEAGAAALPNEGNEEAFEGESKEAEDFDVADSDERQQEAEQSVDSANVKSEPTHQDPSHFKCPAPPQPPQATPAIAAADAPADGFAKVKEEKESQQWVDSKSQNWDKEPTDHQRWDEKESQQWDDSKSHQWDKKHTQNWDKEKSLDWGDEPYQWQDKTAQEWQEDLEKQAHQWDEKLANQWEAKEEAHWDKHHTRQWADIASANCEKKAPPQTDGKESQQWDDSKSRHEREASLTDRREFQEWGDKKKQHERAASHRDDDKFQHRDDYKPVKEEPGKWDAKKPQHRDDDKLQEWEDEDSEPWSEEDQSWDHKAKRHKEQSMKQSGKKLKETRKETGNQAARQPGKSKPLPPPGSRAGTGEAQQLVIPKSSADDFGPPPGNFNAPRGDVGRSPKAVSDHHNDLQERLAKLVATKNAQAQQQAALKRKLAAEIGEPMGEFGSPAESNPRLVKALQSSRPLSPESPRSLGVAMEEIEGPPTPPKAARSESPATDVEARSSAQMAKSTQSAKSPHMAKPAHMAKPGPSLPLSIPGKPSRLPPGLPLRPPPPLKGTARLARDSDLSSNVKDTSQQGSNGRMTTEHLGSRRFEAVQDKLSEAAARGDMKMVDTLCDQVIASERQQSDKANARLLKEVEERERTKVQQFALQEQLREKWEDSEQTHGKLQAKDEQAPRSALGDNQALALSSEASKEQSLEQKRIFTCPECWQNTTNPTLCEKCGAALDPKASVISDDSMVSTNSAASESSLVSFSAVSSVLEIAPAAADAAALAGSAAPPAVGQAWPAVGQATPPYSNASSAVSAELWNPVPSSQTSAAARQATEPPYSKASIASGAVEVPWDSWDAPRRDAPSGDAHLEQWDSWDAASGESWVAPSTAAAESEAPWPLQAIAAAHSGASWAEQSAAPSWAPQANASEKSTASWASQTIASEQRAASLVSQASAAEESAASWVSEAPADKQRAASWASEFTAAEETAASWDSEAPADKHRAASWASQASAAEETAASWASEAPADKHRAGSWASQATAAEETATSWASGAPAAEQSERPWVPSWKVAPMTTPAATLDGHEAGWSSPGATGQAGAPAVLGKSSSLPLPSLPPKSKSLPPSSKSASKSASKAAPPKHAPKTVPARWTVPMRQPDAPKTVLVRPRHPHSEAGTPNKQARLNDWSCP